LNVNEDFFQVFHKTKNVFPIGLNSLLKKKTFSPAVMQKQQQIEL